MRTTSSVCSYLSMGMCKTGTGVQYDPSANSFFWSDAGEAGYVRWWKSSERVKIPNVTVGRECLMRVAECTWWNWDGGSTPFFWQWLEEFRSQIRFDFDKSPAFNIPQQDEPDPMPRPRSGKRSP
jgi:hypothetical protein